MAGREGWARGGSLEAVKASVLLLIALAIDVWFLFYGVLQGNAPAAEVIIALLALNILVLGLGGHYAILSRVRKGLWTKTYPLSDTTLLDTVDTYFDGKGVKLRDLGESHDYTDSYSSILKSPRPSFEVRIRPVTFPSDGVAVMVGPLDKKNRNVLNKFMDDLDGVLEEDLKEGIRRVKPSKEEEE